MALWARAMLMAGLLLLLSRPASSLRGGRRPSPLRRCLHCAPRGLGELTQESFTFLSPRIVMGRGIAATALQKAVKSVGARPLLVIGKGGLERLASILSAALPTDFDYSQHVVFAGGEPTVDEVRSAVKRSLLMDADCVVAIGGGSALDLGKAVAALAPQPRDLYDYLEVIGNGYPLERDPLPVVAVPTTAGTGSEATKNAVIRSPLHRRKASLRHEKMLPAYAIVDPMLTFTCPPSVTANVGADTLCQVLEPFVCNAPNPIADAICKEGIVRASRSLRAAVHDGRDIEAREDLAVASVLGGLALANARLGAVHGFAAVLGGMFDAAPHGAICAALLPHVFERNVQALRDLDSDGDRAAGWKLARFQEAARLMTGDPQASASDGTQFLRALVHDIHIPRLNEVCCGLSDCHVEEIVAATQQASSTQGNPVVLDAPDLRAILSSAR